MSKLGKKAIHVPKETTVKVDKGKLTLNGPKGIRELNINDKIFSTKISKENIITLEPLNKKGNDEIKKSKWRPARQGREKVGVYLTKTFKFSLEQAN